MIKTMWSSFYTTPLIMKKAYNNLITPQKPHEDVKTSGRMPLIHGDTVNCCPPTGKEGKRKFQGKAFIPDDHIQLIASSYHGANLNLEFEISDEEISESLREKKYKYKSKTSRKTSKSCRSRRHDSKRLRSKRHRKHKTRCRCCRCGKPSTEDCCNPCPPVNKTFCCCSTGANAPRIQDSCKKNVCSPPPKTCCRESSKPVSSCYCAKQDNNSCCKKQNDHCSKQQANHCCENRVGTYRKNSPHKCCEKKHDSDTEKAMKLCPCCVTRVPQCGSHDCWAKEKSRCSSSKHSVKRSSRSSERDMRHTAKKSTRKSTSSEREVKHQTRESPKKSTLLEKEVEHHPRKSSKKSTSHEHPNAIATSHDKEKRSEQKADSNSKSTKKPAVHVFDSETKDQKNVYVAKRVSSLEENEVYGKYWYHRPPLENVITHCGEDCYEYTPPPTENHPHRAQVMREECPVEKERKSKNAGFCVGCKEPICLICKNFICNCECNRPNFVICTSCRHKMTPKKKKVCPPPQPKCKGENGVNTVQNGVTDGDAMFLLPLLASMQANANCQSCNC